MKKLITSAAILTGVLMFSQVQAAEQDIETRLEAIEKKLENTSGGNFIKAGNKKIDVTLYGQVNKAVMLADDGENDDVLFVDNDASSTRFGIKAKTKNKGNLSAGAQFEAEVQGNDSNKVSMEDTTYSAEFKKRQMKVYVEHKKAGKLTLGHGSVATDGISEMDMSGTKLAGYSKIALSGGGFEFWDNNDGATGGYSGVTVGDDFDHLDGGRMGMVRYDSPSLAGLTLSAAGGEENYSDIALTYHKKLDLIEIKGGVGYAHIGEDRDADEYRNRMSGSASVLFNFGLNLTVAAGNAEFDDVTPSRDDASFSYFKVGYKFDAFSFGSTAVSVDYGMFDDFSAEGDEGTVYGFQLVQKVKDINTEFYLGFRNMELDRTNDALYANVSLEDIQTTMAGARFKF